MKRLAWSLVIAGALGVFPAPRAADAYPVPCSDCGDQFPGGGELDSALRYWCKILSVVFCPLA